MSFWSRIGDAFDWMGDRVGDAWSFAEKDWNKTTAGIAKTWREEQEVNPAARWLNRYGIEPTFSALETVGSSVNRGASAANQIFLAEQQPGQSYWDWLGRGVDPNEWKRAWARTGEDVEDEEGQEAEGISFGQSFFTGVGPGVGMDAESVKDREEFFHHTWHGKVASGAADFALAWYADPTIVAGKAAKAARLAKTTVRAEDVEDAVRIANSAEDAAGVSRRARRAGNRIQAFVEQTDGMTATEMMHLPQFQATSNSAVMADLFAEANRVDDDILRHQIKRDVFGSALGSTTSRASLRANQEALQRRLDRFVLPIENSEAARYFQINDFGDAEMRFLNSQENLTELTSYTDQIEREIARMQAALDVRSTTRKIATDALEQSKVNRELDKVRERIIYSGLGGRPIRILSGGPGSSIPHHINVKDSELGFKELEGNLARTRWLSGEQKSDFLDQFLAASDASERAVLVERIENTMFAQAGQAYGRSGTEIRALIQASRGIRQTWKNNLKNRLYSAAEDPTGRRLDFVTTVGPDGEAMVYPAPLLRTQIEDSVSFTDPRALDRVLKSATNSRWLENLAGMMTGQTEKAVQAAGRLHDAATYGHDLSLAMANSALSIWKFMALARVAYPMRIQVDTQLRALASIGGLAYVSSGLRGTKNWFLNRKDQLIGADDLLELSVLPREQRRTVQRAESALTRAEDRLRAARREKRTGDVLPLRARVERARERLEAANAVRVTPTTGMRRTGLTRLEQARTPRGQMVELRPAADLAELEKRERLLATDNAVAMAVADATDLHLATARGTGDWGIINGGHPDWPKAQLRAVNQQIRNSPVAMRVLSDPDDASVARWIRSNPAAREEWSIVRQGNSDIEAWVANVRAHVEHHLPEPELRAAMAERQLTVADVDSWFPDTANRPDIHGENYTPYGSNPVTRWANDVRTKFFKVMSDMPEQVMGRHPVYNNQFRRHLRDMVENTTAEHLTEADIRSMRIAADRLARKDVLNTLYDVSQQSEAAIMARYISPFYSAWSDTMRKWGRLFYEDPSRLARGAMIWQAPNNAGLITEEDGVEYIILPAFGKEEKWGVGEWKIRKDSFNIVFQGEPWWLPGGGPLVQVPTNEVVKKVYPNAADNPILKWIMPYGPSEDSAAKQLLPAWAKRVMESGVFGNNPKEVADVYAMLLAQEQVEARLEGRAPKSEDDIAKAARNWFLLRAFTANAVPVSAKPTPRMQLYIDKAHEYRKEYFQDPKAYEAKYGVDDWQKKFYQDFPDYFEMSISLSLNETGITASEQAIEGIKKWRKYIAGAPEFGWMFVGPDNIGDFSQGAYTFQKSASIGYGTSKKFRGTRDPKEALRQMQVERGWIEYNSIQTKINLIMEKRGIWSLTDNQAQDIKAVRDKWIDTMRNGNPAQKAWYEEYMAGADGARAVRMINTATAAWKTSPELRNRPDMQALRDYLAVRQRVQAVLATRQYRSLDRNPDVAQVWGRFTQNLIAQNIGFEQMWNRVLQFDNLTGELPEAKEQ